MAKLPLQQFDKEETSPFRFTRVVLGIPTAKASQKAVLTALAIRANSKTSDCHPSYDRLMKDTGLSRSVVAAAVVYLRDVLRVVSWKRGHSNQYKKLANLYRLDYRKMLALAESAESDLESAESDSVLLSPIGDSAESDSRVAESDSRTPTAHATNTSVSTNAQVSNWSAQQDFFRKQEQEGVCGAPKSVALSPTSELSTLSPASELSRPIPDYAEYDPSYPLGKQWGFRRDSGNTTPERVVEIQRLNRERIKPQSIQ